MDCWTRSTSRGPATAEINPEGKGKAQPGLVVKPSEEAGWVVKCGVLLLAVVGGVGKAEGAASVRALGSLGEQRTKNLTG